MRTLELRRLQEPSSVEKLLHEVVGNTGILPAGCAAVRERDELPMPVQRIVTMADNLGQSCAVYSDDHGNVWILVAELSLRAARERHSPVLQIDLYGGDGGMIETGRWVRDARSKWRRWVD